MAPRLDIPCLYVTEAEAAKMLHRSTEWLRQNSDRMEKTAGFPKIDPVVGRRHREAIETWARERNQRQPIVQAPPEDDGVNWDAL